MNPNLSIAKTWALDGYMLPSTDMSGEKIEEIPLGLVSKADSSSNSEHWEEDSLYNETSRKGGIHVLQRLVLLFREAVCLSTAGLVPRML